jgi:hypothetical protein
MTDTVTAIDPQGSPKPLATTRRKVRATEPADVPAPVESAAPRAGRKAHKQGGDLPIATAPEAPARSAPESLNPLPEDQTPEMAMLLEMITRRADPKFSVEEFGPLAALVPPGERPNDLRSLLEQIAAEVKPNNILDRLLVHDIARSTVFGNYLWAGMMDAFGCLEEDAAHQAAASDAADRSESKLAPQRQARGRTFIAHNAVMAKLASLNETVRSGRHNSIAALDSRQLAVLRAALEEAGIDA